MVVDGTLRTRGFALGVSMFTLVGGVARAVHLDLPVRIDEAFTYRFVTSPISEAVSDYILPNNHILHTLLAKATTALFGNHLWSLRLPAFVLGVLLVPLTAFVVRRLVDESAGLLAAALVAGSAPLIAYAVQARGYTLVGAAFLGLVILADRIRVDASSLMSWVAFVLLVILGAWAVPVMLYGFVGIVAWLAIALRRSPRRLRRLLVACIGAGIGVTLVYTPVIARSGVGAITANRFVEARPIGTVIAGLPAWSVEVGEAWATAVPWWGIAVALALGVPALARSRGHRLTGLVSTVMLATITLVLLGRRLPFVRTTFFLIPMILAVPATGAVIAARRVPLPTGIGAVTVLGMLLSILLGASAARAPIVRDVPFPDAPAVAQRLARAGEPNATVIAGLDTQAPLAYHLIQARADVDQDPLDGGAVFAVVNHHAGERLADVVSRFPEVAEGGYDEEALDSYPESTLYRIVVRTS